MTIIDEIGEAWRERIKWPHSTHYDSCWKSHGECAVSVLLERFKWEQDAAREWETCAHIAQTGADHFAKERDELRAIADELHTALRLVMADRPSVHGDEVWRSMVAASVRYLQATQGFVL
jgi:hypothetical protein